MAKRSCTVGVKGDKLCIERNGRWITVSLCEVLSHSRVTSLTPGEFRKIAAAGLQMCDEIEGNK